MESEDSGFVFPTEPDEGSGITRRRALQAGAVVAGAGLLAACGSSSSSSSSGSASSSGSSSAAAAAGLPGAVPALEAGTPKMGGTLTVGLVTGGSSENVWPGTASILPDWSRQYSLYNFLLYPGVKMSPLVPGLATSWEPNKDATVWTFHLRQGVTWHDGTPFTSADAVYNFKIWSNAQTSYGAAFFTGVIDTKNIKAKDKYTVEVPLLKAVAQFPTLCAWFNFGLVKNGTTAKQAAAHPIGTGAWKYQSFTPGQQSVFVKNPDYWEQGKPYADTLVIDSSFNDYTALTNAFLAGKVNLYPAPPFLIARQQLQSKTMQVLKSPVNSQNWMFNMRVDKGEFADNRVRQAFKLLVNRQEIVNGAWAGVGVPAPDLIGVPGVPYYLNSPAPAQDVEKAKSLFKAAGAAGKTYSWPIADYLPGAVESVTLMAQQAPAAGITVKVQNVSAATYFTAAGGAYTRPAGTNVWQPACSLMVDYASSLTPTAPFHDTWWAHQTGGNGVPTGTAAAALMNQAFAEVNQTKAADLWHECQQQQINYGGYIIWGNQPYVDAAAPDIRGMVAGAGLNFNNMRFQDAWIA